MAKLRVGIVFGGRSTEHEVSVVSATTVLQALDPSRYVPVLLGIDHLGRWRIAEPEAQLLPEAVFSSEESVHAFPTLTETLDFQARRAGMNALGAPLDVLFPIVHGRGGEDGVLQGLFELAGLPYVGAGVLASAVCMDKTITKRVLRDAGIPVLDSLEAPREALLRDTDPFIRRVEHAFDYPVFVKPTNTGSSVGVLKAKGRTHLHECIKEAARYDRQVLVEPSCDAREVECAVLGGHEPQASVLGEIVSANEFYDYEAKYASDATELRIPAELSEPVTERIRSLAVEAFLATKCWGMARVDFFVDRGSGEVWLNELNTLPGFTEGSMYPRLWEASGIAPPNLVDRLIELALERHREQRSLETRFNT